MAITETAMALYWDGSGDRIQLEYIKCSITYDGPTGDVLRVNNDYMLTSTRVARMMTISRDNNINWTMHFNVYRGDRFTAFEKLRSRGNGILCVLIYCLACGGDENVTIDLKNNGNAANSEMVSSLDPAGKLKYIPAMQFTPDTVEEISISRVLSEMRDRTAASELVRGRYPGMSRDEFDARCVSDTSLRREIVFVDADAKRRYKELLPPAEEDDVFDPD